MGNVSQIFKFPGGWINYKQRGGDPSTYDWTQATLTQDAAWHDLDLSSIISEDANVVVLKLGIQHTGAGRYMSIRPNGNTNTVEGLQIKSQVNNISKYTQGLVRLPADKKLEYFVSGGGTTTLQIYVVGWFFTS